MSNSEMSKLSIRKLKWLTQGHTASKQQKPECATNDCQSKTTRNIPWADQVGFVSPCSKGKHPHCCPLCAQQQIISVTGLSKGVLLVVSAWRALIEMEVHGIFTLQKSSLAWTQIFHLVIVTTSDPSIYFFKMPVCPYQGGKFTLKSFVRLHWSPLVLDFFLEMRSLEKFLFIWSDSHGSSVKQFSRFITHVPIFCLLV